MLMTTTMTWLRGVFVDYNHKEGNKEVMTGREKTMRCWDIQIQHNGEHIVVICTSKLIELI